MHAWGIGGSVAGHGGIIEAVKSHATAAERPYALQPAIMACRPGGTVSLPGVFIDAVRVPMGTFVGKALTMKPDKRTFRNISSR
jgi:threonine dehydrogenase-like Zn-dependent dehydrogenase